MSIKIALAGNPNCGKTTLFNALTGSNQFVGNWPGVTVEKKEGKLKWDKEVTVTDLPGIYSLSPYTMEEVVARKYLLTEQPDAILNIIDGTNIERNLYLTTQLLELGIPVVLAVNMMDVVRKTGDVIRIDKLKSLLGCETVEISALKGEGIKEAVEKTVQAAGHKQGIHKMPVYSPEVEAVIDLLKEKLSDQVPEAKRRFYGVKLLERDGIAEEYTPDLQGAEACIRKLEEELDEDAESIVTNERYLYIASVVKESCRRKSGERLSVSDKIDRIVTNRFLALPIFAVIMFVVYYISVSTVGTFVTDWANDGVFGEGFELFGLGIPGIPVLAERFLTFAGCSDWLMSLLLDGIIGGVGAVLGFVPQMLILFLFLVFLESCGYMARVAFIMDRIFRKFGLSGKSFIPMLIGSGCSVPGIMASRTIENDRDRKMTIITTSFIPCGAKLPIIALIAGALFSDAWWVAPSAYFIGITAVVVSGIILKKTPLFSKDAAPFVMELPAYHMPTVSNVLRSMWERGWSFIKKAGSIILLSTIVIWFLENFGFQDGRFGMVEDLNSGLLANIGNAISFIFAPLGWGSWQASVAAITGLIAKENVVGTFGVLFGAAQIAENGEEIWNTLAGNMNSLAAYSFLVFNLLCAPCFAAMGAIKREMNNRKWFWFAVGYQTVLAYAASLCIYQIGTFIMTGQFGVGTAAAGILLAVFGYLLFRPGKVRK